MSDNISNIIKLKLKPVRAFDGQYKKVKGICFCSSVLVVEYKRMLECQNCGKAIDPFDYLFKIATKQQTGLLRNENLKRELNDLTDELIELKKDERNIKARIKTALIKEGKLK